MMDEVRGYFLEGLSGSKNPQAGVNLQNVHTDNLRSAAAVILINAAKSDLQIDSKERLAIVDTIERHLALPRAKVTALLEQHEGSATSSKLNQFTQIIKKDFDLKQRTEILSWVWAVIAADGIATNEESSFAANLRNALGLSLEQAIQARKLAEHVELDGFKEPVEADQSVIDTTRKNKPNV